MSAKLQYIKADFPTSPKNNNLHRSVWFEISFVLTFTACIFRKNRRDHYKLTSVSFLNNIIFRQIKLPLLLAHMSETDLTLHQNIHFSIEVIQVWNDVGLSNKEIYLVVLSWPEESISKLCHNCSDSPVRVRRYSRVWHCFYSPAVKQFRNVTGWHYESHLLHSC